MPINFTVVTSFHMELSKSMTHYILSDMILKFYFFNGICNIFLGFKLNENVKQIFGGENSPKMILGEWWAGDANITLYPKLLLHPIILLRTRRLQN